MDQRFAVKAHVPALHTFGLQPLIILERVIHTVHDHQPFRLGRQQAHRQRGQQRKTVRAEPGLQFLGKVIGAHHHPRHLRMRRDLGGIQHPARRFHHRPDRQIAGDLGQSIQLSRTLHLGQQHRITLHLRDSFRIGPAPVCVQPIDPHDPNPRAISTRRQRRLERFARGGFFIHSHRIFEVKDDRIHRQSTRLVQCALL